MRRQSLFKCYRMTAAIDGLHEPRRRLRWTAATSLCHGKHAKLMDDGLPYAHRNLSLRRTIAGRGSFLPGIAFNKHFDVEGSIVFHHACKLGCEGIVSKRLGSPYRFGRSNDWMKIKNPVSPAVKREAEEEWRT